jgi:hypothetical protein
MGGQSEPGNKTLAPFDSFPAASFFIHKTGQAKACPVFATQ